MINFLLSSQKLLCLSNVLLLSDLKYKVRKTISSVVEFCKSDSQKTGWSEEVIEGGEKKSKSLTSKKNFCVFLSLHGTINLQLKELRGRHGTFRGWKETRQTSYAWLDLSRPISSACSADSSIDIWSPTDWERQVRLARLDSERERERERAASEASGIHDKGKEGSKGNIYSHLLSTGNFLSQCTYVTNWNEAEMSTEESRKEPLSKNRCIFIPRNKEKANRCCVLKALRGKIITLMHN